MPRCSSTRMRSNRRGDIVELVARIRFGRRFLHEDRRSYRRVVIEMVGHSLRQTDATVRGRIRRHVTLMHGVTAPEKHGVGHASAIEMRTSWPRIFPGIDIRFCDVAEVVNIIAEDSRDVILVFREDLIVARRSRESFLAGGNGRFADKLFAFEEISALEGDIDDYFWRSRDSIAIPITGRWGGSHWRGCDRRLGRHFLAAGEQRDNRQGNRASK